MSADVVINDLQQAINCGGNCNCCQELEAELTHLKNEIAKIPKINEQRIIDKAAIKAEYAILPTLGLVITQRLTPLSNQLSNLTKQINSVANTAGQALRSAGAAQSTAVGASSKAVSALARIASLGLSIASLIGVAATIKILEARTNGLDNQIDSIANDLSRALGFIFQNRQRINGNNSSIKRNQIKIADVNDAAYSAQKNATSAREIGENALKVANNAQGTAQTANSKATGANTTAQNASSTATRANRTAQTANTKATQALGTAQNANTKATQALGTAQNANTKATQALNTAQTALQKGNTSITRTFLTADRTLNVFTADASLHNAYMLSGSLSQTLFSIVDGIGNALFKDAAGQSFSVSQTLGKSFDNWAKGLVGVTTWEGIKAQWVHWNRIYQSGANVLNSFQNTASTILNGMEITGGRVGKIANALRGAGAVLDNAYGWMNPQPKFNRVTQFLENLNNGASTIQQVIQIPIDIAESVTQLKKSTDDLNKALGEDNKPENKGISEPESTTLKQSKQASKQASPGILTSISDFFDGSN